MPNGTFQDLLAAFDPGATEANVLVPRRVDQESRTPSFKNVPVRVAMERSLPVIGSRGPGVVHAQS